LTVVNQTTRLSNTITTAPHIPTPTTTSIQQQQQQQLHQNRIQQLQVPSVVKTISQQQIQQQQSALSSQSQESQPSTNRHNLFQQQQTSNQQILEQITVPNQVSQQVDQQQPVTTTASHYQQRGASTSSNEQQNITTPNQQLNQRLPQQLSNNNINQQPPLQSNMQRRIPNPTSSQGRYQQIPVPNQSQQQQQQQQQLRQQQSQMPITQLSGTTPQQHLRQISTASHLQQVQSKVPNPAAITRQQLTMQQIQYQQQLNASNTLLPLQNTSASSQAMTTSSIGSNPMLISVPSQLQPPHNQHQQISITNNQKTDSIASNSQQQAVTSTAQHQITKPSSSIQPPQINTNRITTPLTPPINTLHRRMEAVPTTITTLSNSRTDNSTPQQQHQQTPQVWNSHRSRTIAAPSGVVNSPTVLPPEPMKSNQSEIPEEDVKTFEAFKEEYSREQKFNERKQLRMASLLQSRTTCNPKSIIEVLSPNEKMSQSLAGRTNFSRFTMLVYAAEISSRNSRIVANSIIDIVKDSSFTENPQNFDATDTIPYQPPHDGYASSLGYDVEKVQGIFQDDTPHAIQLELWRRATQFIHGPPHARVEGYEPYRYRGFHNHDRIRTSPYHPVDLLRAICRARHSLHPIAQTSSDDELFRKNLIHQFDVDVEARRTGGQPPVRSVGDSGNYALDVCSEEAISNSLDGLSLVLKVLAKHITRRITRSLVERAQLDAAHIKEDEQSLEMGIDSDQVIPWYRKVRSKRIFAVELHHAYEVLHNTDAIQWIDETNSNAAPSKDEENDDDSGVEMDGDGDEEMQQEEDANSPVNDE